MKPVSKQIAANPKVEICAFKDGKWLRVSGELVDDNNREVKVAMLEKIPALKSMYSVDDDNTQVLYCRAYRGTQLVCLFFISIKKMSERSIRNKMELKRSSRRDII